MSSLALVPSGADPFHFLRAFYWIADGTPKQQRWGRRWFREQGHTIPALSQTTEPQQQRPAPMGKGKRLPKSVRRMTRERKSNQRLAASACGRSRKRATAWLVRHNIAVPQRYRSRQPFALRKPRLMSLRQRTPGERCDSCGARAFLTDNSQVRDPQPSWMSVEVCTACRTISRVNTEAMVAHQVARFEQPKDGDAGRGHEANDWVRDPTAARSRRGSSGTRSTGSPMRWTRDRFGSSDSGSWRDNAHRDRFEQPVRKSILSLHALYAGQACGCGTSSFKTVEGQYREDDEYYAVACNSCGTHYRKRRSRATRGFGGWGL